MSKKLLITKDREDSRTLYFDVLNVLGTLFVVWIHFGNEVHWYDGSTVWYWCLFIQVIAYWAVPVFFMLTGATLMDYQKKYSTKTFFIRRFRKTVIPYLFWGAIISLVKIKEEAYKFHMTGRFHSCYIQSRICFYIIKWRASIGSSQLSLEFICAYLRYRSFPSPKTGRNLII